MEVERRKMTEDEKVAAGRHTWDDYQDKLTGVKRVSFNISFGD